MSVCIAGATYTPPGATCILENTVHDDVHVVVCTNVHIYIRVHKYGDD